MTQLDGWNVELEYEFGSYARRLTWGQDLSQTLQGAGGVGGLVMTEELLSSDNYNSPQRQLDLLTPSS